MKIEAFLLCDAATDSQGKLNVLGAFDTIFAKKTPVLHQSCSIALRIRFSKLEEGEHKIKIDIVNEDGGKIVPSMDGNLSVKIGEKMFSSVVNLVLNIQRLKFENFGEYSINLAIDGREASSLPVYFREIK